MRREKKTIPKVTTAELAKDSQLVGELVVAEKLGYTLNELRERITPEELSLWFLFYELRRSEEQKAMDKAKRQRR